MTHEATIDPPEERPGVTQVNQLLIHLAHLIWGQGLPCLRGRVKGNEVREEKGRDGGIVVLVVVDRGEERRGEDKTEEERRIRWRTKEERRE